MNVKSVWLKTLAVTLLCAGLVRSQERIIAPSGQASAPSILPSPIYGPATQSTAGQSMPYSQSGSMPAGQSQTQTSTSGGYNGAPGTTPPATTDDGGWLSSWILYGRPCCCFPLDGNPIGNELYLRSGISELIGAKNLSETLRPGWDIEGGFRVSFFNHEATAAWVVDVGLSNEFNTANSNRAFTLHNVLAGIAGDTEIPRVSLVIKNVNRTSFNYGGGREWYLQGSATDNCHPSWRVGTDIGGRWGSMKMNFENFPHRTEEFLGTYADVHTDYVFPWKCYEFFAGFRIEWDYEFAHHILQANDTEITEFNFLFEGGIRF
jgi:hypothetical protein